MTKVKKNIAIIPARGGSKRIPKKNIVDFQGKPLIAWSIEAAIKSKLFDKVVVSTDSQEIAEISIRYGASVPFLRDEKADDISPVSEATIETLKQMGHRLNENYDVVVQLMANCPLRDEHDIQKALDHFKKNNFNFQISCFKFGWMNPWWALKLKENGQPEFLHPNGVKTRSQDLPELFCPTGSIWIAKTQELFKSNSFYGPDYRMLEMNWMSAIDIDDNNDFMMAQAAFMIKHNQKI